MSLGQYEQLIRDFDEAIRIDPHDAVAYFTRGVGYIRIGQRERGVQDFDEAIRLDPSIYRGLPPPGIRPHASG